MTLFKLCGYMDGASYVSIFNNISMNTLSGMSLAFGPVPLGEAVIMWR